MSVQVHGDKMLNVGEPLHFISKNLFRPVNVISIELTVAGFQNDFSVY